MATKVTTFTGGTGGHQLIKGLMEVLADRIELNAIVGSSDNGGAQRLFVSDMGYLPTSDFLQGVLAVTPEPYRQILHLILEFRFQENVLLQAVGQNLGGNQLSAQSQLLLKGLDRLKLGNLVMMALSEQLGSEQAAFEMINDLLPANVLPATYMHADLVATYSTPGGLQDVVGETFIDDPVHQWQLDFPIISLGYSRVIHPNKAAINAIRNSDICIFGPGDVFTSTLQPIVVPGIIDAISATDALKVMIMNLMTKRGQTYVNGHHMTASEHLRLFQQYLGTDGIDVVIIHHNGGIPEEVRRLYQTEESQAVVDDLAGFTKPQILRADLMSDEVHNPAAGDFLRRSRVRHDPLKTAQAIALLLN